MENTVSHLTDVELVPQGNISPIVGVFDDVHSKPFLEAIQSCSSTVPNATSIAAASVFFAESAEKTNLSQDEVAAINLYTIECDFYRVFNQTLRDRDRKKIIPFFPYLKHLLIGLNKLPSYNGKLWRGVKLDLRKSYPEGKKFFWWSFSSCTVNLKVLESEQFCGKSGDRTLFCISSQKGKDIKMFSNYADEGEVLLMPGYFIVKSVLDLGNGATIIDLEELPLPFDIFIGIPKTTSEISKTTPTTISNTTIPTTIPTTTAIQAIIPSTFQKIFVGVVKNNPQFIHKFGSYGTVDGQFRNPRGIAIDANGNIVVADQRNHRIQVFGANGKFIHKFGSKGKGNGQFDQPMGVAIDANGNIVVVDYGNCRIQVFGADGNFIHQFGESGSKNGQLNGPCGVAIDDKGNIVVADRKNCQIQIFETDGNFIEKSPQISYPRDVAISPNGSIVVTDTRSDKIVVRDTNRKWTTFGYGQLNVPYGVAIDANGNIIVADEGNHQIQVFGANGKFIHKFGSKGNGNGQFNSPRGVAIDANGNIIVSEYHNDRIQVFG